MICVEGPLNKMLIGRQRGGPFHTPFLYTQNKSIAVHVDYNADTHKTSFTHLQLVSMIRRLIEISTRTGRIIRLAGWKYFNPVKSLFDVDLLNTQHNVTLVEGNYWENFRVFSNGFNLSTLNYAIKNQRDYDYFLKSSSQNSFDEVAEIFITFSTTFLDNSYDEKYEEFLCKFYDEFSIGCTRTCSGNHFRFRN
jgi:hypothetical protein